MNSDDHRDRTRRFTSPTGAPQLVIANEISGTVNLIELAAN